MKNSDKIAEEIEKTMESFEGMRSATTRPFFYTRLEAKMQQRYTPMPKFALRPAFIWSFLALIVLVNLSVVINYSQKMRTSPEEQNASAFAQEYGLNTNMFDTNL